MALHSYKQGEFSDALAEKQRNGFVGSDFLDTRWSGVGSQMADHELEEGEACDDPDSGCDPDTAFAYLDEKLSMVLGDVQKFFEGGVSAEKLGSKFGGYGSFLPTQERTPSILQDKPPTAVVSDAYCRSKKSSNEGLVEKIRRTTAGSSVQASNFKAGSSSPVLMHESRARGAGAVNEKSNNDSSFPEGRVEQNANLPKRMLLRFKVGSDTNERKKNTTIYNDFGLGNSSSASEDEDEDEDQDSDHYSSPDRTPLTMIRIMTSHHIPDGTLLSPLPDLVVEPFIQKERLWSTNLDGLNEKARSPNSKKVDTKHDLGLVKDEGDAFEKMDISRDKAREHATERRGDSAVNSDHVLKRVKVEKDKGGSKDSSRHTSKQPLKALAKDVPKPIEVVFGRQARDAVSESGTGARSIESHKEFNRSSLDKAPPDYSLYEGEHGPKDFCSPFQPPKEIDLGREVLSRGFRSEKATASTSHDSMNEHLDTSHPGRDVGKEVFNTAEINSHAKRHLDVCTEPVDGRKRSSGKEFIVPSEGKTTSSQDAKRVPSKSVGVGKGVVPPADIPVTNRGDFGREAPDARKRSKDSVKEADVLRGTSKDRVKEASKDARKSSGKEKHIKTNSSKGPIVDETTKGGPQPSFKTVASKDFQQVDLPKVQKTENFEHKKKEKSKDRIRSDFKEPPKFSEELASRDVFAKASQAACVPDAVSSDKPFHSALPPPETGSVVPVTVVENWVGCDSCEKWRLLPPGVDVGHLPSQWRCKMLYWLEGMNNCNVPEEVTTKATQAVYNIVPPVPPPSQEIPPVVEQVQPPAPNVTSLPPSIVQPSRETKAPEKAKAGGNKKRKIPPITSTDTVVLGKSNASHVNQEANQTKLGWGDTITDQEKTQAKLGAPDSGHVKVGEEKHVKVGDEKRKVKEKEKAKRPRVNDGASPFGKEHNLTPGNIALRDATNLKHTADRFQGSKEGDRTGLYFQAALKFLQAASLLESEAAEHGENRQYGENRHGERRDKLPLSIYAATATLCDKYCARNYERSKEFAAAALAYKCAGLALMRVVQANSMSVNKDRAEIQSAHQVAPGESPSSLTALDTDAQNNSTMDRAPARGTVSPALTSNTGNSLIIAGKIRPSLHRLLQYVTDTSGAIEAWAKASSAYSAAESASVYSPEAMSALKRVLDYGFHDVMSLVQLVRIALEAMGH